MSLGAATAADVVVVGSGVAGLAAAVEAEAAGLRVAVLEARAEIGGASGISVGGCCIVDTPLQEAAGIADSVELAAGDWRRAGGPQADMVWARSYLRDSRGFVYDWCRALGVEWVDLRLFDGNSVPRWHLPCDGGPGVMAALLARLERAGVDPIREAKVTSIKGAEGGGLELESTAGPWRAGAVIMATGGFAASAEMLLRHRPSLGELPRFLCGGDESAVGSGHALLAELGASFRGLDRVWIYPVGTPSHRLPPPRGLVVRGVDAEIWLNAEGVRFHDETRRGGASGTPALMRQPGATAWGIFDADTASGLLLLDDRELGTPLRTDPRRAEEFWESAPFAWRARTLGELAERSGLPPDRVEGSVARFNELVERGRDDDFGRPPDTLRPIVRPPFHAIRYLPLAQKTFGGARTGPDCQVVDAPRGIFAAGELTGMAGGGINGVGALEGTMFGPCIYSGRLAGIAASRFVAAT